MVYRSRVNKVNSTAVYTQITAYGLVFKYVSQKVQKELEEVDRFTALILVTVSQVIHNSRLIKLYKINRYGVFISQYVI